MADPNRQPIWLHPERQACLGNIRLALFDFDGTISTLRQGWEEVMIPLMIEQICGPQPATPAVEAEVREYVDRSTGILTIQQMEWLAQAVARWGLNPLRRTAREYKTLYLERLMKQVSRRVARLECGQTTPEENTIAGSLAFVRGLVSRGVRCFLASGTDHHFVRHEAGALGILDDFEGGVFGALDESDAHAKDRIIHDLLTAGALGSGVDPHQLLVVGDGSVEIREAAQRGAFALGVASDEVRRSGWNPRKIQRLEAAGADLIIPDFLETQALLTLFCGD